MGQSRSLVVLLIVVLAIVGYLWLSSSLTPPAVSTTPTVPPAAAPAPAAP